MNQCIRHLIWRAMVALALLAIGIGGGIGLAGPDARMVESDDRCGVDAPGLRPAADTARSRPVADRGGRA